MDTKTRVICLLNPRTQIVYLAMPNNSDVLITTHQVYRMNWENHAVYVCKHANHNV